MNNTEHNRSLAQFRKPFKPELPRPAPAREFPPNYLPGRSPAIQQLHREIELFSKGTVPVMLVGETGVGKEHMARLVHLWSSRSNEPFIAVNCAAIPADLLEAEMFGIGKGVATGVQERAGYFQAAHKGTLFLDEISEMGQRLQAKLLRALQSGEVQQVGAKLTQVDVRIVSATNSNLLELITRRKFRADLYYRLAGFILEVPALHERREDLTMLIDHFVAAFEKETGKTIWRLAGETLAALCSYSWPGNIRELEHEIRRLLYLSEEGIEIEPKLLSSHIRRHTGAPNAAVASEWWKPIAVTATAKVLKLEIHRDETERSLIIEALERSGGNKTKAAALLGVSRNGLSIKMYRLGIELAAHGSKPVRSACRSGR